MPMKIENAANNETPNQTMLWSYCLAIVSVCILANVLAGGLVRESVIGYQVGYALATFSMIAIVGVYASDGSLGLKFVRACSRHKL